MFLSHENKSNERKDNTTDTFILHSLHLITCSYEYSTVQPIEFYQQRGETIAGEFNITINLTLVGCWSGKITNLRMLLKI